MVTDAQIESAADDVGNALADVAGVLLGPGNIWSKVSAAGLILFNVLQTVQPLLDAGANPLRLGTEAGAEVADKMLDRIPANVEPSTEAA